MVGEPDSGTGEDEAGEALARAVAADAQKYRRLLVTYAALLAIPIFAGVWIWATGVKQQEAVEGIKVATMELTDAKQKLEANTEEVREQVDALVRPPVPVELAPQEAIPEPPPEGYFLAAFADPTDKAKLVGWNVKRSDGHALKSVSDLVMLQ